MIKLDNVNKYYNKGKANQIHVINNTTMTLPDRGIVCLLGPSGCGKTTLLNAIGGLDKVNSGKIYIDGKPITRFSTSRIDTIRNASIGYIFQNFNLLDNETVFENVAIALRMVGIRDSVTVDSRVRYCLDKVGIDQYRNKLAGSLSGGQRQRVAIARAIVKNPDIIIADEPTGNLDSANTLEIMNIIKTISRGKLVILVTHERSIAEFYSDHVAEMKDGKIVKAYSNDSSRYLDYQLENKIYLKDMPVSSEFRKDDIDVKVYADDDRQADIKLVIRGNNLYIDTGGHLNVVDETSNIEMIDDHYTAMDETYFENSDFNYTAYLPANFKPKYTSIYRLSNMLAYGWKTIKGYKRIKKFLMIGFVFAAMFAFLAVSNVLGLLEVKPVDFRNTNGHYISVSNAKKTEDLMNVVAELKNTKYVIPGDTRITITMPMDDYLQSSYAEEDLTVSLVQSNVLKKEQILYGKMPKDAHDVVLDKTVADEFLRDDLGKSIGLTSVRKFVGRRLTVPNLEDYKIVGIVDTQSPSLFVDESQMMYILTNGNEVDGDFTMMGAEDGDAVEDAVKSGQVMDLALTTNKIKVSKGKEPEKAYETILNIDHQDEVELGSKVNVKLAGKKLKVVGFYTSDNADDDTYYVTAETIKKDYISKKNTFSVYAKNPELLKVMLDEEGIPSSVNDDHDKAAYIHERKDQLISALVVAGVIMLISLIEMFLMLRSSFLSRIKEIGTLRAIGLKKKDIYRMFTGEILVMTFITAIPGIAIMYFVLGQLIKITYYLEGLYMVTPQVALITFAIVTVFNLLAGLIPVFVTMRKTPAQILARTDI